MQTLIELEPVHHRSKVLANGARWQLEEEHLSPLWWLINRLHIVGDPYCVRLPVTAEVHPETYRRCLLEMLAAESAISPLVMDFVIPGGAGLKTTEHRIYFDTHPGVNMDRDLIRRIECILEEAIYK